MKNWVHARIVSIPSSPTIETKPPVKKQRAFTRADLNQAIMQVAQQSTTLDTLANDLHALAEPTDTHAGSRLSFNTA